MKNLLALALATTLVACSQPSSKPDSNLVDALSASDQARLTRVLEAQDADTKARYPARHPAETLSFLGIKPGMTVVEVLPGGGWYSRILGPYLGAEGTLIGVDYPLAMFDLFDWATPEFIANRANWGKQWQAKGESWPGGEVADLEAYNFDGIPRSLDGTVDAVLYFRALHNLSRFDDQGGYRTQALARTFELLKPGGRVGVVQHQAPETSSSAWAEGDHGYLKQSEVIAAFERAGLTFVAASDVNANPKDQPGVDDDVWRLPPSLANSKDDPERRARYEAIGESNRMTLLFVKPGK